MSLELAPRPEAIAEARRFVRRVLADHLRVDDATLAASELVTNVLRHAPASSHATVVIEPVTAGTIRVSVRQRMGTIGPLEPQSETGGHGLKIVAAVSNRWGVERNDWMGIWFEISS